MISFLVVGLVGGFVLGLLTWRASSPFYAKRLKYAQDELKGMKLAYRGLADAYDALREEHNQHD